jgi:hypothetical protein
MSELCRTSRRKWRRQRTNGGCAAETERWKSVRRPLFVITGGRTDRCGYMRRCGVWLRRLANEMAC